MVELGARSAAPMHGLVGPTPLLKCRVHHGPWQRPNRPNPVIWTSNAVSPNLNSTELGRWRCHLVECVQDDG